MRALVLVAVACSAAHTSQPLHNEQPRASGRHGSHGMIAFGTTHHYLEHIPMFKSPHDAQVLVRVTLRDPRGQRIDLGKRVHTVKPTTDFSLDALMQKRLATFDGELYAGNFEAGGTWLGAVRVTVEDVLLARALPGTEPIAEVREEYLLFGVPGDSYVTNMIRASRGYQQILHVDHVRGTVLSPSKVTRVLYESIGRLEPDSYLATDISFLIDAELWCYEAPEFVTPCR